MHLALRTLAPAVFLTVIPAALVSAQQGTRLLRQPTVSATQIAFAYAGDIWIVAREGGDARRLTSYPGVESSPSFSPDGQWVAFSGEYAGNPDVYVVSVQGGSPRRLTWHPGADLVRGWSADSKSILFASGRQNPRLDRLQLWTVPLEGGYERQLPLPVVNRAALSPDGHRFAFEEVAQWDVEWRNYRGGQNRPIQIFNLADSTTSAVPWEGSKDTWPAWVGNAIYFISDRDWAGNVWRYEIETKGLTQVTHYKDFDVKTLGGGGGVIVYEQAGYLHLYDPASGQDRQLVINVRGDLPWAEPRWTDVTPLATAVKSSRFPPKRATCVTLPGVPVLPTGHRSGLPMGGGSPGFPMPAVNTG